jgi:hypothetical protein
VRLFGSFELRIGERRLASRDFAGAKPRQLLELLVLHRGRTVFKDERHLRSALALPRRGT